MDPSSCQRLVKIPAYSIALLIVKLVPTIDSDKSYKSGVL